ncbi:mannan endo-1,4-beta-mannosidase [Pedobacter sp. W3I1]|uniref:glycoside hydrolase family 26 protein n=1 Tax=Pedobacter sp. W3I1 TaxID=3042291 RepID=UPI002780868A|nr:glycosyl hydrolase [Pedobacter sp. W3I1]MDQ0638449.1 mannan endo-1,4-beta-mannosidase [Pedobacter sp. W3I1]
MIKKILPCFLFFCLPFVTVFGQLIDGKASLQTKNLYKNLAKLSGAKVLFGHQDDLAYGVGWKYQNGRSDIKDLTGEYPAVFGWDISGLETNQKENIDGVPFDKMKQYIKKAYDLGTINTLSWHMDNPISGKNSWDTSSIAVKSILPSGSKHLLYKSWLDKFSVFVKSLRGTDGKAIPILFRPFHENGGGWFWWGAKSCTPQEYKALWQFTISYLRDKKQLHNLIYVFNPCGFKTEEQYLERYPGNNYVDVLSFDYYQYGEVEKGESFAQDVAKNLAIQNKIARRSKKISALAETGYVEIPDANWWTNVFAKAIQENKPSYVLFWRNAGYREKEKDNHYYAPYPGQISAPDFLEFIKGNNILLQKGLKKYSVYN